MSAEPETVVSARIEPRWLQHFTVAEYHRMAGVLEEGKRIELLQGMIFQMTPQGRSHARVISHLNLLLSGGLGGDFRVRVQSPLSLADDSEPEPDLAVVTEQEENAALEHPRTAELVIEVSDSSVSRDRQLKMPLYARANIREYWIVNVRDKEVEVYRDPDPLQATFRTHATAAAPDVLRPLVNAVIQIRVDSLFR